MHARRGAAERLHLYPAPARRAAVALGLVVVLVAVAPAPAGSEATLGGTAAPAPTVPFAGLEPIGRAELPPGSLFEGEPVGGLSGLAWDAGDGTYLAISDDASERAPARVYRLRIDLGDGRLDAGDAAVVGRVTLSRPDGSPFPPGSLDPEGIALAGERLYFSSEGNVGKDVPPFLAEAGLDGRVRRFLPLPDRYLPRGGTAGVRHNLAFESLALSPDGRHLFAATENALAQDGPAAEVGVPSPARILRYRLDGGGPPEELAYRVEAIRVAEGATPGTGHRVNGLTDLLPLGAERLLVLERQYVPGLGNEACLYLASLAGADEVSALDGLERPEVVFAAKRRAADLGRLGFPLDNLEGMAFGPRLPDGRRSLLLVSDDNFDPEEQRTQVLAFAVDEASPSIAAIQGAAHRSPLEGRWALGVEGVVTATADVRGLRGFWMESEAPDGNPATSEGIFVAAKTGPLPEEGSRVAVHGRVAEAAAGERELPVTRLELESLAERPGRGELPAPRRHSVGGPGPATVDDDGLDRFEPGCDALDLWESREGMRVSVGPGLVSGATTSFGELVLLPDGAEPGPRTAAGGARRTAAGAPLDRALLAGRLAGGLPALDVGSRVDEPVAGIVDYSFSNYKVLTLAPLAATPTGESCRGRTALASGAGRLTVASFNVENLSAAGPPERFARLGAVIAEALAGPALVGLQEVQDDSGPADDGVVTSRATVEALVGAIAAAGGPAYEAAWIDPEDGREGGQPGGNIRVALLADPRRARIVRRGEPGPLAAATVVIGEAGPTLVTTPARIAPESSAFTLRSGEGVRRSLAVELEVGGRPLFVVVNHWSSKFEDDRDYGARQPPRHPSDGKREAQAEVIRAWAEDLLRRDPGARLVVLGDLNDSEWARAVTRLAAPPLENLLLRVPEAERYTYVFEGAAQVLDHVVVSPALAAGAEADVVHVNADCADERRSSDHDPLVVRLRLGADE